jgi:glycine betaine/proline transport system ATP-binding protein
LFCVGLVAYVFCFQENVVFQQFGLLPWRTVRENVGLGLELRGEGAAQRRLIVDEKLELVGLSQWAERYVSELSGGMQQRVGLARAFATDAEVLLMDEPFSALDPLIRGKLQDELLTLQARVKKTILFVSHDLDEALRLGDHISILQNGRIIQTGTAEDIVLAPADEYVAEFVRHMNPLTVLTGSMIMQRRSAMPDGGDGHVWLDAARRYRLSLNSSDEALGLQLDGVAHAFCHISDEANLTHSLPGLAVAPASLSLQSIIQLRQSTGHPVLLAEDGRILGVCGETEIIRALAGGRHTSAAAP